jgi:DNA replication and repair protein RecF
MRASALAKHLPVQTLLPHAADLVLGGPGERRGFLDWGVFHVEQRFVEVSRSYRRVLNQRNAWLKSLGGDDPGMLGDPWMTQLCALGTQIGQMREVYVDQFTPLFHRALNQLSPQLNVELEYEWGGLVGADQAEKKLGEAWSRDVKFGVTHRGPHRADLRFTAGGQDVSETVSRGQAKLIASAAILAQAELLYQHSNAKSLILIDDFGAELDAGHWQQFLGTLLALECQVIATSTLGLDAAQSWIGGLQDLRVFHVKHGHFERQVSKVDGV